MKKTTVYMLLAVAGIMSFIFYACSKPGTKAGDKKYVPLDFEKANLGEMHNEVVRKVYKRYNQHLKLTSGNRLSEAPLNIQADVELDKKGVREQVMAELHATPVNAAILGITDEQYYTVASGIMDDLAAHDFDIRNFASPGCSPYVMAYVSEILDVIEGMGSLNDMSIAFDDIALRAAADLHGMEKDEVTGVLAIARASAYLWSNEDGLFNSGPVDMNARIMGGAKKVIVADVSASASFFLRMGVMGAVFASTPGSNVVILTGWALSAGISSACAALFSTQHNLTLPRD